MTDAAPMNTARSPWEDWAPSPQANVARDHPDSTVERPGRSRGGDFTALLTQLALANVHLSSIHAAVRRRAELDAPSGIQVETMGDGWWTVRWEPVLGATAYLYQHEYGAGTTSEPETPAFTIPTGASRTCVVRAVQGTQAASPWVTVRIALDSEGRLRAMETAEAVEPLELATD